MHMLTMVRGGGEEPLAVAERAAEHTDLISGTESRCEQAVGVEALPPLAVEAISFRAAGGALGLARVDQHDLEAPSLQELEEGHPVGSAAGEVPT
jgi:hypothetical protein